MLKSIPSSIQTNEETRTLFPFSSLSCSSHQLKHSTILCSPPPPNADDSRNSELERFVRNKYEYRTFMAYPSPVSTPQPSLPPCQLTPHQPPPTRSPNPPTLPSRQSSFAQSAFASSSTTSPPPLPIRQPTLPSFSQTQSQSHPLPTRRLPKSVRFPETPPTRIPSPPDSEDEDSYDRPPPTKRRATNNGNVKSVLKRNGYEIPIDWAALTREPSWGPDEDDDDVPLQALGALGMRGAQVGLVGVPQSNGGGFTPMAQYGVGAGSGTGGMGGGLQPLMPQFTGSAKGYLHEQHAGIIHGGGGNQQGGIGMQGGMVPQALKPQMTGSVSKNYAASHAGGAGGQGMDGDAFSRMFQPPSNMNGTNQGNGMGIQSGGGQGGYGSTSGMMGMQSGGNGNQSNSSQQFQQFAQPPPQQQQQRTNPFTQFAQPQPQHPAPSQTSNQLQPPPSQNTFTSIWDDLTSLSPSPSHTPQPAPQPLRPQLTGFTPSSSFGQQLLARESSPAPPPPPSQFLDPSNRSSSPFTGPTPQPLKPQYTGYVPSSTLNLSQHQPGQGAGSTPQPLRPQVTGFVPSSSFGQSLLQQDFNNFQAPPSPNSSSPAPFDSPQANKKEQDLFDFDLFPSSNSSNQNELQPPRPQFAQPQQQQRSSSPSNPFNTMPSSFVSALPPQQQQQFAQPQMRGGGGQGTNPFLMNSQPHLQQQNAGYYPQQQQQQALRQQVTGFGGMGGGGGGTNPFLTQQGGSGMFGNGSGFR